MALDKLFSFLVFGCTVGRLGDYVDFCLQVAQGLGRNL